MVTHPFCSTTFDQHSLFPSETSTYSLIQFQFSKNCPIISLALHNNSTFHPSCCATPIFWAFFWPPPWFRPSQLLPLRRRSPRAQRAMTRPRRKRQRPRTRLVLELSHMPTQVSPLSTLPTLPERHPRTHRAVLPAPLDLQLYSTASLGPPLPLSTTVTSAPRAQMFVSEGFYLNGKSLSQLTVCHEQRRTLALYLVTPSIFLRRDD